MASNFLQYPNLDTNLTSNGNLIIVSDSFTACMNDKTCFAFDSNNKKYQMLENSSAFQSSPGTNIFVRDDDNLILPFNSNYTYPIAFPIPLSSNSVYPANFKDLNGSWIILSNAQGSYIGLDPATNFLITGVSRNNAIPFQIDAPILLSQINLKFGLSPNSLSGVYYDSTTNIFQLNLTQTYRLDAIPCLVSLNTDGTKKFQLSVNISGTHILNANNINYILNAEIIVQSAKVRENNFVVSNPIVCCKNGSTQSSSIMAACIANNFIVGNSNCQSVVPNTGTGSGMSTGTGTGNSSNNLINSNILYIYIAAIAIGVLLLVIIFWLLTRTKNKRILK